MPFLLPSGQGHDPSSLDKQVTGLAKLGTGPAILGGLGVANLMLPNSTDYSGTDRLLVTVFLFTASVIVWASLTYIALKRSQYQLQTRFQREEKMMETVRSLVEGRTPDEAREIMMSFANFLTQTGVLRIESPINNPQEQSYRNPPNSPT